MKKHKGLKVVFGVIGGLLALVILAVGCFLIYASVTTLKVQDSEELEIIERFLEELNEHVSGEEIDTISVFDDDEEE